VRGVGGSNADAPARIRASRDDKDRHRQREGRPSCLTVRSRRPSLRWAEAIRRGRRRSRSPGALERPSAPLACHPSSGRAPLAPAGTRLPALKLDLWPTSPASRPPDLDSRSAKLGARQSQWARGQCERWLKHCDCFQEHFICSPEHSDWSSKHTGCSDEQLDCSRKRHDCPAVHCSFSSKHHQRSPNQLNCLVDHSSLGLEKLDSSESSPRCSTARSGGLRSVLTLPTSMSVASGPKQTARGGGGAPWDRLASTGGS
jgi:hypothetical protein